MAKHAYVYGTKGTGMSHAVVKSMIEDKKIPPLYVYLERTDGLWRVIAHSSVNPKLVKIEKLGTSEALYVESEKLRHEHHEELILYLSSSTEQKYGHFEITKEGIRLYDDPRREPLRVEEKRVKEVINFLAKHDLFMPKKLSLFAKIHYLATVQGKTSYKALIKATKPLGWTEIEKISKDEIERLIELAFKLEVYPYSVIPIQNLKGFLRSLQEEKGIRLRVFIRSLFYGIVDDDDGYVEEFYTYEELCRYLWEAKA